jgi:hypothetical protein
MIMTCRVAVMMVLAVAACTEPPNVTFLPTAPAWMEWPAEVRAGAAFDVRFVHYAPGCYDRQELRVHVERGSSDLTIRSEWLVAGESNVLCVRDPGYADTIVAVAGLAAAADRIYSLLTLPPDRGPIRTMGTILVRPTAALSDHANGAGYVTGGTDFEGCAVMQRPFDAPVPVENPPAGTWQGFVRGYFFTPTAPLCGQTRAFHVAELR